MHEHWRDARGLAGEQDAGERSLPIDDPAAQNGGESDSSMNM
jgi:hypothetical protein